MRTRNHPLELFIIAAMCTAILGSCSKNLSRISAHKPSVVLIDSASLRAAAITTRPVKLDTLTNQLHNRISISAGDSYYMGRINAKTAGFYRSNGFETKWLHDLAPGPLYKTAMDILKNAGQYGLNPYDYDVAAIEQSVQNLYNGAASPDVVAALDIHISEMYFLFTTHLTEGRIRSVANGKNIWKRDVREGSGNDVVMLTRAENGEQLLAGLDGIQPANEQYLKLQQALA
ncbi:MAG TPA: hypothetical protein VK666_21455, partial [Chryseolinea sp.]|nr:hypothetical protein [Chryseolinea sp.]